MKKWGHLCTSAESSAFQGEQEDYEAPAVITESAESGWELTAAFADPVTGQGKAASCGRVKSGHPRELEVSSTLPSKST